MDQETYQPMTPFDEMVGNEQIQFLKAALPYLPPQGQQFLCLFSKVNELQNTLRMCRDHSMQMCSVPAADPICMLNDIRRFCSKGMQKQLDQMANTFTMLQMIQLLKEDES